MEKEQEIKDKDKSTLANMAGTDEEKDGCVPKTSFKLSSDKVKKMSKVSRSFSKESDEGEAIQSKSPRPTLKSSSGKVMKLSQITRKMSKDSLEVEEDKKSPRSSLKSTSVRVKNISKVTRSISKDSSEMDDELKSPRLTFKSSSGKVKKMAKITTQLSKESSGGEEELMSSKQALQPTSEGAVIISNISRNISKDSEGEDLMSPRQVLPSSSEKVKKLHKARTQLSSVSPEPPSQGGGLLKPGDETGESSRRASRPRSSRSRGRSVSPRKKRGEPGKIVDKNNIASVFGSQIEIPRPAHGRRARSEDNRANPSGPAGPGKTESNPELEKVLKSAEHRRQQYLVGGPMPKDIREMIDGIPKRKGSPRIAVTDLSGTPSKKARSGNRAPKTVDPYLLTPAHKHRKKTGGTRKKISSPIPYNLEDKFDEEAKRKQVAAFLVEPKTELEDLIIKKTKEGDKGQINTINPLLVEKVKEISEKEEKGTEKKKDGKPNMFKVVLAQAAAEAVQLKSREELPPPTNKEIAQKVSRKVMALARRGDWASAGELLKEFEGMLLMKTVDKTVIDTCTDTYTGNTLLMYATIENKLEFMGRLLALGAAINKTNSEKYTALHFAAMYSREDTIQFLLTRKANPNLLGGPMKQTCVHLASARMSGQSTPTVELLLQYSNKEVRYMADLTGNIPLFCAIEAGNGNVVRKLLSHHAEKQVSMVKEPVRDSAMHLAVRKRDPDMCKTLVESGSGVDMQNDEGQTPLHLACIHGCAEIIRVLFLARASPSIYDKEDRAPIYMAAERGHTVIVEFLIDKFKASVFERSKDGSTLMHIASLNGHPETAICLYERGVPLLMPNKFGERSIHTASKAGHVGVVKTLLKKGENVNAMTQENNSALHIAVENGQSRVVETLLGHGANVQLRGGKNSETALHIAARIEEGKGERCTKQLVKSGADPNAPMGDGRSAVHNAAANGNLAVLRVLLQNGGDAQLADKEGETGLHKACKQCHFSIVQELMQFIQGFIGKCTEFVNRKNAKGETALHYAAMISKNLLHYPDEDKMILTLLMENGADVTVLTELNKESAFHYVSLSGS